MRVMKNMNGYEVKVLEHIILKNFWEYYVLECEHNTIDIKNCLVLGFENEIGDVSMSEIRPYILSRTANLNEVAPAPNWDWI